MEDILSHSRPGSHDAVVADADAGDDDGSDADKRAVTDLHLPGEPRPGGDVDAVAEDAIVVDTGSGVDDPADTYDGVRLDNRSGHDNDTTGQSRRGGHDRRWVDQCGDGVPLAECEFQTLRSSRIVTNCDKDLDGTIGFRRGEPVAPAQDLRSIERLGVTGEGLVQKARDLKPHRPRDIGNDFGVPSSAPDQKSSDCRGH